MLTRHKVLRLGAVSIASVFFTMSAVGATYAAGDGGNGDNGKAAAASDSHRGGGDHGRSEAGVDHAGQGRPSGGDRETSSAGAPHAQSAGTNGNGSSRGNGHTPVTVCHLLGNGGYIVLTFDDNALKAHLAHGDLYPVPADGCPGTSAAGTPEQANGAVPAHGHTPVTVCHLLGNGGYIPLTFDSHALDAHLAHGDLYPAPADGCPSAAVIGASIKTSTGDLATTQQVLVAEHEILTVLTTSQEILTGAAPRPATVLGTEAIRTGTPSTAELAAGTTAVRGATAAAAGTTTVRGATAAAGTTGVRGAAAAPIAPAGGLLPNTGAAASLGAALLAGLALLGAGAALLTRKRGLTGR